MPFVFDAARLRRNLAQLLVALGDRDGAMRELRRAHDVFARIGAESGAALARAISFASLGARPPARAVAEGAGALTGREREIARLVAARKSNKEIGAALGISSRTVSTHLSNVFAKLGVTSRGELTDRVRDDVALRVRLPVADRLGPVRDLRRAHRPPRLHAGIAISPLENVHEILLPGDQRPAADPIVRRRIDQLIVEGV